jgi:hypothetical protein
MPAASRSQSGSKKAAAEDNALLQKQIDANKINTPRSTLLGVGLVTAFLPAYLAHSIYYIELTNVYNLPLFAAVIGLTGYLLAHSYDQLTHAEFLKRVKHYQEVRDEDTKLLKDLRLQTALGYSMFLINVIFFVGCTAFQTYLFRQTNPYFSFVLSPLLIAAFVWILAEKSMDLRKQKMGVH